MAHIWRGATSKPHIFGQCLLRNFQKDREKKPDFLGRQIPHLRSYLRRVRISLHVPISLHACVPISLHACAEVHVCNDVVLRTLLIVHFTCYLVSRCIL